MKQDQAFYEFQLFICTNKRTLGEDCCSKGSEKIIEELKPWLKDELKKIGKEGRGRINKSGCLGRCGEGIACVAYPSGEWFTDIKVEDVEKLKDWIRGKLRESSPQP